MRPAALAILIGFGIAGTASAQALDPFNAGFPGALTSTQVRVIQVQPDGKIVVGGLFTTVGAGCGTTTCPTTRLHIARFHQDGSLDLGFDPGADRAVNAVAVLPDGKLLAGGEFLTIGGVSRRYFVRLNADGSVDQTFLGGANAPVGAIVLLPDGKILVGGSFSTLGTASGEITRNRIGRLNADGSVDTTFESGANNSIGAILAQPDGRIVVGGDFTSLGPPASATPRARIGLLNHDGSVDAVFNPGASHPSGGGFVSSLIAQPDGKILVGGFFTTIGGLSRLCLARVSASGVVDAFDPQLLTFLPDIAQAATVLQADGRILITGFFESVGVFARPSLARVQANGSVDTTFDPTPVDNTNSTETDFSLRLDDEGRVLVGGSFWTGYGAARDFMARLRNTYAAVSAVTVSPGGSTVTWTRGGSSPEVDWVTFESTLDGVTWTMLGTGARTAGGWELTGQSVPASAVVRARGFHGGSIFEAVYLPAGVNFIRNPGFSSGVDDWLLWATPDPSYLAWTVANGVFEFTRVAPPPGTTNQAVIFQDTGLLIPKGTPLVAEFQLGNSDGVWKRFSVILHDRAFGDLAACLFWVPPGAPLQTYTMAARPTQTMTSASLAFYAASIGSSGGSYRLDNVSLQYAPGQLSDRTMCTDPITPAPPVGTTGPNLLINGDFGTGTFAPWFTFGQIQAQVAGGVAQFIKLPGVPGGTIVQPTSQSMSAGEVLTATFTLGNSSSVRKRVLVLVHDFDFSDLAGCSFWVPPGQPLTAYTVRMFTREAWENATLSVYPGTVGPDQWIRFDDAVLQRTPSTPIVGTECVEPAAGPGFRTAVK